ncbi:MAG TPA: DUF3473 domain-containing protein [Aequorivita sp.]|nr:DUF3473 domain-containing protein [Aequorivita sp.]
MKQQFKSAFTVDVEDGISGAMRDVFNTKVEQTDRVVRCTSEILDLCAECDVKGTFFILGEVAEDFPQLIKDIAGAGHELGIHGYHHKQFFRMTKEEAYEELSSAKKLIEDLSGMKVEGHRAPAFSVMPETEWALDVIADTGFTYDSSIMPCKGKRYGWPGFSKDIGYIKTPNGKKLVEVPMTTTSFLGRETPVAGGGYLRLFPLNFTKRAFESTIENRPAIIYMHPYEVDTEKYPAYYFDALNKVGFQKRWNMKSKWWNRKTVYPKLKELLSTYEFDTLETIIKERMPLFNKRTDNS